MRLVYQKNSLSSQTKRIPHSHGGKKNIYPANQEKGFTQNLIQQKINYLVESLGWQQTACAGWGPAFNESRILQNFTAFQRNILFLKYSYIVRSVMFSAFWEAQVLVTMCSSQDFHQVSFNLPHLRQSNSLQSFPLL